MKAFGPLHVPNLVPTSSHLNSTASIAWVWYGIAVFTLPSSSRLANGVATHNLSLQIWWGKARDRVRALTCAYEDGGAGLKVAPNFFGLILKFKPKIERVEFSTVMITCSNSCLNWNINSRN